MRPSVLVFVGMLTTALAQVLLKHASHFDEMSTYWLTFMGVSAVAYGTSFLLYSRILKYFPLNKIYPAMTVGQIVLVTLAGLMIGEAVTARHAVGLVLGMVAIYLVFS